MTGQTHTLIIGVGNDFRGDDCAGLEVARRLRALNLPGVVITEHAGEGAALMETWRAASRVILIDAAQSGAAPGTVHRLDASTQAIPAAFFSYSTHAFSVAEAVEMARALGELPPNLIIYGIEGTRFALGEALSPAVEAAIARVTDAVARDIRAD